MADAAFIAYVIDPYSNAPLKDNTRACMVYSHGHPYDTGTELYRLLKKRVLSDNLHDACQLLVDSGVENNGWDRLNFIWQDEVQGGQSAKWPCTPRYGINALRHLVFDIKEKFDQAYRVIYQPVTEREINPTDPLREWYIDTRRMNYPIYSEFAHPLVYEDPFRVRCYDATKVFRHDHLWLYLIDPYKEVLRVFTAIGARTNVFESVGFDPCTEYEIDYIPVVTITLKRSDKTLKEPFRDQPLLPRMAGERDLIDFLDEAGAAQSSFRIGGTTTGRIQYRTNWGGRDPVINTRQYELEFPADAVWTPTEVVIDRLNGPNEVITYEQYLRRQDEEIAALERTVQDDSVTDFSIESTPMNMHDLYQQMQESYQHLLDRANQRWSFASTGWNWNGITRIAEDTYQRGEFGSGATSRLVLRRYDENGQCIEEDEE